ncbi:HAMP domain-containing histidine kinase [Aestuariibacter halophilus]|uniref:histidine kinase n=1 Tax=Fluctibacter halophilus TaxID=226011 RepID=A0ABS8G6A3_9ALTE|nr:HAMP domain-containing sensor histidine kinase [Aestuariibacter halophilus]MCC2616117.1 HAMP domain-containing histidine kinase [Aestuariibacter halophilus]
MRIGSLRQLTLGSFMLALVPLGVLLWHSQNTLSKMSEIAASEAQFSVGMVRDVSTIKGISIDIERVLRQHFVLNKPELVELATTSIHRLRTLLDSVCTELPQRTVCIDVDKRLNWFIANPKPSDELLLDAQLAEFRRSLSTLQDDVDSLLDTRIQQQQQYVSSVQQTQAWSTGLLVTVSLILMVFASQLILAPVAKIERVIGAIARQDETLPGISQSGPKELIELEHKLHWLADRLTQLEHLRHALLRHASHELKTPLASIKEGCSLLSEQVVGRLNNQQQEVLSLLNNSTERLNLLIEQLLDYNLLLQQAKPVYQQIDPSALVNDVLSDNALAIQQNDHQVEQDIELDRVYVDPNLYRRILDNLLSNALAHGSVGRPIHIHLYALRDMVVLDVGNRGQRVPKEQWEQLFEPFKRGENRRNDRVTGSGLGLSIVADCARMMHGSAEIVEVEGADFCVRVCLPANGEYR